MLSAIYAAETFFTPTPAYGLDGHLCVSTGGDDVGRLPLKISGQTIISSLELFSTHAVQRYMLIHK